MPGPTRTVHADVPVFVAKDGSRIREIMHPRTHAARALSLAEATVPPGDATALHRHVRTEEVYHFLAGRGVMTLGEAEFRVGAGDTVCVAPGTPHRVRNDGPEHLVLLCACAPPYADDDTVFVR